MNGRIGIMFFRSFLASQKDWWLSSSAFCAECNKANQSKELWEKYIKSNAIVMANNIFYRICMILALLVPTTLTAGLTPIDEVLGSWPPNEDDSHKSEIRDLDELGGQPPITVAIIKEANVWADKNLPGTPHYYLSKVPKRGLVQDLVMKRRQDNVMEWLRGLRTTIAEAYGQCIALKIDTTDFIQISKDYCEIISSKNWKDIGNRDPKRSLNAAKWLRNKVGFIWSGNVNRIYTNILLAKKSRWMDFSAKHPEIAQVALANQHAKKAKMQAYIADAEAVRMREIEESDSWWAEELVRRANRSGANGLERQNEQEYLDELSTRTWWKVQKDVNKGRRKPLSQEENNALATPGTAY